MNKARLLAIASTLSELHSELTVARDTAQDKYDDLPAGHQEGDLGETVQEFVSNLENVISSLEDAEAYCRDASEQADRAR
jgi:hypothetical protein